MEVDVRKIFGPWKEGYLLDRHIVHSEYLGEDEDGKAQFDNTRSEAGEALFQLKYRSDWSQVKPIAQALFDNIIPNLPKIDLIVPVPASTPRARQPVDEIAQALGQLSGVPVSTTLVQAKPPSADPKPLKNLTTKEEKDAALQGRFSIDVSVPVPKDATVLVVDDLFATGASMGAICTLLQTHPKVASVYAAAVTKTGKA